jgi:hypothetical protein
VAHEIGNSRVMWLNFWQVTGHCDVGRFHISGNGVTRRQNVPSPRKTSQDYPSSVLLDFDWISKKRPCRLIRETKRRWLRSLGTQSHFLSTLFSRYPGFHSERV